MRRTTSIPRRTSPKTTLRASHHGAGTVVMKNCAARSQLGVLKNKDKGRGEGGTGTKTERERDRTTKIKTYLR